MHTQESDELSAGICREFYKSEGWAPIANAQQSQVVVKLQ